MENNIKTQDIRRQATWYKCGTDIAHATSIGEALKLSGLDYKVVKAPIYLSNGYKIPGQFATKKEKTNETFGIVGKDYEVVQNLEAFEFVDSIIPEGLKFEKAGETSWMNWIIASLPEQYILGDNFVPYVVFQNSHSGGSTVKASISPLRIACSNQFTIAFREAHGKVALKHTRSVHDKMVEAQKVLFETAAYMDTFRQKAEEMAAKKITDKQLATVTEILFPINDELDTTRRQNSMNEARKALMAAYNEEDLANFKGTQWGLLNAYSDYITHKENSRHTEKSDISKFVNVTLNPQIMKHFMEIMNSVC